MRKNQLRFKSLAAAFIASVIACTPVGPLRAQPNDCKAAIRLPKPPAGIALEQICQNGSSRQNIEVDVTDPAGHDDPQSSLAIGQQFAPKTSLLVPSATFLDLLGNGVMIRARYGVRTTILADTPEAPAVHLDGLGGASFVVQHVLGLFHVDVGTRFTAAVPGTTFDIDLADPASVVFSVSEGRVSITRLVSIHLDREARDVDLIRVTQYIDAALNRSIKYQRAAELWQHFADAADARQHFKSDLESASAAQNPLLEKDANWNLGRLDVAVKQKHRGHISPGTAAAAAALGIFLLTRPHDAQPQPAPSPTVRTQGNPGNAGTPPASPAPSPPPPPSSIK
ncbi:MAG: hypothetical protein NVSMB64_02590 [Candidatus Velthaea sp.]